MATLLTCVDVCDPYVPGMSGAEAGRGPALAALACERPDRLVLLVASPAADAAAALEAELARAYPRLAVEWAPIPLSDPALRERLSAVLAAESAGGALTVCVNAGPDVVRETWAHVVTRAPAARWVALRVGAGGAWSMEEAKPRAAADSANEAVVGWAVDSPRVQAQAPDLATACRRLGLRGEDPAFRAALDMAARLAPHPVPLLIQGETGTGKGLLAALIHEMSGRGRAPFVAVNCAALPETLVESILFGHRKGSFTGAAADQPGKFVLADGGTLFLDEVGELPLPLQAKLLRVLEDGVVEPLGAVRGTAVNVRVVAATHRDLRAAVADRSFREDLFFRLGYAQLLLPPLRARAGDIKDLALHQLTVLNRMQPIPRRFDASAIKRLEAHSWPGNIRELAHVVGRSVLLSDKSILQGPDLLIDPPPAVRVEASALPEIGAGFSLETYIADTRRLLIQRALDQAGGNKSKAARLLGISPQAVHAHLKQSDPTARPT
jgi:DNA-binding NtrC family response regulator